MREALCALIVMIAASANVQSAETKKVLEKTLFHADETTFRYSEASVIKLKGDRELLMAVSVFGQGGHDNTPAQIIAWPSHDGGVTWNDREKFVLQENIGKETVLSPAFLRLSKNEILFFFLVTNSIKDCGPWMKRSADNGKSWSAPERLPYDGYGGHASDHAVLLKSGRVVLPCWVSRNSLGSDFSYCFYSDDKGRTWGKSNEITVDKPSKDRNTSPAAEEPAVVELKNGRLLMLMRTYAGSFFKSYSGDGGATWSNPVDSGIPAPGAMPTLVRIPTSGDLLLLFNYADPGEIKGPFPRNRMASAISNDEGKNFTLLHIFDGTKDFPGKMTMANITFVGNNAVVFYSKSPNRTNFYSWMEQILPIRWFYEGDSTLSFGEKYLGQGKSAPVK